MAAVRLAKAQSLARQWLLISHLATAIVAIALVIAFVGPDLAAPPRHRLISLGTPLLVAFTLRRIAAPLAGMVAIQQGWPHIDSIQQSVRGL